MKKLLTVLAALAAALVHGIASAQPVELRFAFPAPPTSYLLTSAFQPWAKEVESASNGTLTIRIVPGVTLATFDNVYDRVLKGIADIGFGLTAPIGGQFTKTSVAGLPFTFDTPHQSAPALWKLYENGLIADEFKDVKPLGLFTFGHANIHTRTVKVRSLADMKGLKIRSGGKLQGDIVAALGGAPVTLNPAEIYESFQSGLIEGASVQWTAVLTFKLAEVAKNHFLVPLDSDPAFLIMNRNSYNRLPPAAKAAIDKFSGEPLARRLGNVVAQFDEQASAQFRKDPAQSFETINATERARWEKQLEGVINDWVKTTPNGAAVLKAFKEEVQKVK